MQENTNKAIAVNTVVLYVRLAITVLCSLFITRFALQALGVDDFGLFSVVGSVITLVAIINTIMIATSHRFIAVAIGKGDLEDANKIFNVCLVIHIAIAVLTAIIAIPVGEWYIHRYINYNGPIENALMVYLFSITASIISFLSVPYNGLLTAKEKFIVFCGVDILSHILKLGAAILMLYFFENKLLFYAGTQAFLTAYPTVVFMIYCNKHFHDITSWKLVRDSKYYKEMLSFSGWVSFGALATVGKAQGAQLLVNAFFNTVMNAALGIANTINQFIIMFANNVTQPMAPQLTKSYASGDISRCNTLLIMSVKYSFLTMLIVSSPFFSDIDWILQLWLGEIPQYASVFTKLLVLDALVGTFNYGISNVVFANGKISFFQITINLMNILSVVVAYFCLKVGLDVNTVFYSYILFSLFKILFCQISLRRIGGFSFLTLFRGAYLPSILTCLLYVPILFVQMGLHPLAHMILVELYLCIIVFFVGFQKKERQYIIQMARKVLHYKSMR